MTKRDHQRANRLLTQSPRMLPASLRNPTTQPEALFQLYGHRNAVRSGARKAIYYHPPSVSEMVCKGEPILGLFDRELKSVLPQAPKLQFCLSHEEYGFMVSALEQHVAKCYPPAGRPPMYVTLGMDVTSFE